jgi:type IV pilus assembly protein PilY1
MIFFGTGQYLNVADLEDTTRQSLYGIWDWGLIWEASHGMDTARGKYLGTLGSDRSLAQLGMGAAVGLLVRQVSETSFGGYTWYMVSDDTISWYDDPWTQEGGNHLGWVMDLPKPGERIIEQPIVRSGNVIAVSNMPSDSPCEASGGNSTIWALDACTGGSPESPFFDVNGDGVVDSDDTINGTPPVAKHYDIFIPKLLVIDNTLYFPSIDSDPDKPIEKEDVGPDPVGMFYWRILER